MVLCLYIRIFRKNKLFQFKRTQSASVWLGTNTLTCTLIQELCVDCATQTIARTKIHRSYLSEQSCNHNRNGTHNYNRLTTGVLCHVRSGSIITGTDYISRGNTQSYRICEGQNVSRMERTLGYVRFQTWCVTKFTFAN